MLCAGTFSIAAYDRASDACGVAVSSRIPAVGSLCAYARAGHGAIATQAWINPLLGVDGLRSLETYSSSETLRKVLDGDPQPEMRQVAVVDSNGDAAAHTGTETYPWCGHRIGPGYAAAGNILTGERTIAAMADEFENASGGSLPERLLLALEAGQRAGGDSRGRQSAALYVVTDAPYPHLDLRVDEHPEPVAELRRIYEVARHELLPFVEALPTRENPGGRFLG